MVEDRFYFTGTRIDSYWGIHDKENEDNTIWIDCPRKYIEIIVESINKKESTPITYRGMLAEEDYKEKGSALDIRKLHQYLNPLVQFIDRILK